MESMKSETTTGGTTIVALPVFPSAVAVIVAVPLDSALTTPDGLTEAMSGALLDQLTDRPERATPFASRSVAASVALCPAVIVWSDGDTSTVATGAGGVTVGGAPACP